MDGAGCFFNPTSELMMKKGLGKLIVYATAVVIVVLGFMIANKLLDRENILESNFGVAGFAGTYT